MLTITPNESGLHITAKQMSEPLREALARKPITETFPDGTVICTEILEGGVVSPKIITKGPHVLHVIPATKFYGATIVLKMEVE